MIFILMAQVVCVIQVTATLGVKPISILEKEMANHSSILAWKISWIEEPGGLQSMVSQRVGHDWATERNKHSHKAIHGPRNRPTPFQRHSFHRLLLTIFVYVFAIILEHIYTGRAFSLHEWNTCAVTLHWGICLGELSTSTHWDLLSSF